jgi:LuxR family maltose regulon positive regulatory protein
MDVSLFDRTDSTDNDNFDILRQPAPFGEPGLPGHARFFVPRVVRKVLFRSELVERLESFSDCALILIVAPIGLGKTTLITNWATRTSRKVVWMTADEQDYAVSRFASHIAGAFQFSYSGNPPCFESGWLTPSTAFHQDTRDIAGRMILEFQRLVEPTTLVVDAFEMISEHGVSALISELVERLPSNINFVIASRKQPPLPLTRLRARGLMREIGAEALRFTPAETAEFLRDCSNLSVTDENVKDIHAYTEGWVECMQLIVSTLKTGIAVDDFLAESKNRGTQILRELVARTMERQPTVVREFLFKTAVLERLTEPLCNAILDRSDSDRLLRHIREENLFVESVDPAQQWFRYQNCFRSLLIAEMNRTSADQVREIKRKAGIWSESAGLTSDALAYATAATDWATVARLIAALGPISLLMTREFRVWVRRLPAEAFRQQPALALWRAFSDAIGGNVLAAKRMGPLLKSAIKKGDDLYYDFVTMQATAAWNTLDGDRCVKLAAEALELAGDNPPNRLFALILSGVGHLYLGESIRAEREFGKAFALTTDVTGPVADAARHLEGYLGRALVQQCRLADAAQLLDRIVAQLDAGPAGIPVAVHAVRAEIAYLTNDLDQAEACGRKALDGARLGDVISPGTWETLARIRRARGNLSAALETIEDNVAYCRRNGNDGWIERLDVLKAEILLEQGHHEGVGNWLASRVQPNSEHIPFIRQDVHILYVRWRLHPRARSSSEELAACHALLERIRRTAVSVGRYRDVASIDILFAQLHYRCSRMSNAASALNCACAVLLPQGAIRPLLDYRSELASIVDAPPSALSGLDHIATLRRLFSIQYPTDSHSDSIGGLIMLTDREHEILRLLSIGLTNSEIGDTVGVTANTVKSHVKNIYFKLDAHSRTHAVAIAREAGIL